MKSGVVSWDICDRLLDGTKGSWRSLTIGPCSALSAEFLLGGYGYENLWVAKDHVN